MSEGGRWDDLGERLGVGALVALIALACTWVGGLAFAALTVAISAVIVWELARMLDPDGPCRELALAAGGCLAVAEILPPGYALPLILAPVFLGFGMLSRHRATFSIFSIMVLVAGFGLHILRNEFGLTWMLWLAMVVIVTDVGGYFAGRFIGGPKFWPRVSPKKTWSGTVAGWVAAAVTGGVFSWATGAGPQLVSISIAISMASQMGDVAESAVKRRMGVKDSSSLLPGHGGLFDRFDGVVGAAVFLLLVEQLIGFPPVA